LSERQERQERLVEQIRERERLVADMVDRFPVFPKLTIERLVQRVYHDYEQARVQAFVPVLVRRTVVQQLRYLED
jgi:hypothetical protein